MSPTKQDTKARVATKAAATLSLLAAALHAGLIEDHLREWWGYGLFFILASIAQGLYGLVMFAMPAQPPWPPERWRAWRRRLYLAGLAGNLAILTLYAVTRTIGIPFFGPEAGQVEAVNPIDLVTKAVELLLVGCLVLLYRNAGADARS